MATADVVNPAPLGFSTQTARYDKFTDQSSFFSKDNFLDFKQSVYIRNC